MHKLLHISMEVTAVGFPPTNIHRRIYPPLLPQQDIPIATLPQDIVSNVWNDVNGKALNEFKSLPATRKMLAFLW